jgi:hypothetical protein
MTIRSVSRRRRGSGALRDQSGTALVAALGIALLLVPLATFAVLCSRAHVRMQHHLRKDIEAFYAAETGLTAAIAQIAPAATLAGLLLGPDGLAGTADDGVLPLASLPATGALTPTVRAQPAAGGLIGVVSTVSIGPGITKVLEALIGLRPEPFTPAAMAIEGTPDIDLGSEGFLLSGFDHEVEDLPGQGRGGGPPRPAFSTTDAALELALRDRLASVADRIQGAGGSPSGTVAQPLDVARIAADLAAHPQHVPQPSLVVEASTSLGTAAHPQLTVVTGECDVQQDLAGNGILVVQGLLRVSGTLRFSGLLVALGGIVFEPGSTVEVVGALWRAPGSDVRFHMRGSGGIAYSRAALAAADGNVHGVLPHRVFIVGWRERV